MKKQLIAAAATLALSSGAFANLLTNGDFETTPLSVSPGGFVTVNNGSSDITGWTVGQTSVDVIRTPGYNAISNLSIDLAGTPGPGSLSQSFTAIVGQLYSLTWDYSNNGGTELIATLGDVVQTFIPTNAVQQGSLLWQATSTSGIVSFSSGLAATNSGPVIDNVVLTAVPEPGTYALMLAGLGVVGWMARRRNTTHGGAAAPLPAAA